MRVDGLRHRRGGRPRLGRARPRRRARPTWSGTRAGSPAAGRRRRGRDGDGCGEENGSANQSDVADIQMHSNLHETIERKQPGMRRYRSGFKAAGETTAQSPSDGHCREGTSSASGPAPAGMTLGSVVDCPGTSPQATRHGPEPGRVAIQITWRAPRDPLARTATSSTVKPVRFKRDVKSGSGAADQTPRTPPGRNAALAAANPS